MRELKVRGTRWFTAKGEEIHTEFVNPPIPIRDHDWSAVEDGYDPGEPDEEGRYHGGSPMGWGRTEKEAIQDLMDQLADREEDAAADALQWQNNEEHHHAEK